jgi:serine/threonine-protein kinase
MFDLGKDDRFYFITMEYVDGVTLEERMKSIRLSTAQAVEILDTLLSVLAAAHREGIVHRDLKPANLMFDSKGRIKVMDFGLARDLKGETSLAGAVGTPAFWAPEQARGEPAGPTADVFAVGVIAYLALTGAVSTASITRRLDRVPPQYRAWVATCLAEDPTERHADGAAAQAAFARARDSKPRNVRMIVGALVGAAVLGAAGVGWIATRNSASPTPTPTALGGAPVVPVASPPDAAQPIAADAGVAPAPADAAVDAASPKHGAEVRPRPVERRDAGTSTAPVEVRPDASSLLYE